VVLLRASAIERTVVGFWIGLVRARGEDDGDENGRAMALRVGLRCSCLDSWLAIVRSHGFPQVVVEPGDCLSGYELQREVQGRTRKGQLRPKSWRPFAVNETKVKVIVLVE
jgi:hypothetical protein